MYQACWCWLQALKQALLQPDFRKLSDTILFVINPVQEQKPSGLRLPEQLQVLLQQQRA